MDYPKTLPRVQALPGVVGLLRLSNMMCRGEVMTNYIIRFLFSLCDVAGAVQRLPGLVVMGAIN